MIFRFKLHNLTVKSKIRLFLMKFWRFQENGKIRLGQSEKGASPNHKCVLIRFDKKLLATVLRKRFEKFWSEKIRQKA